jgi:carbon-monoxide dehydrogenase large subunit
VTLTTYDNRVIVNSLEPRGCSGEIVDGRLHVAINGQGVWGHKTDLARLVPASPRREVRVTNPDVGGGFGMKAMRYPEHFLVALAARETGGPVHWMSERTEAMLSDNAGRDLDVTCTLGFDADHKLVAYKVDSLSNMGAYNSEFGQNIQSSLFSKVLTGTYDVQTVHFRNRASTPTRSRSTPTAAPDGPRRSMHWNARWISPRVKLGVDPAELRRKNFIRTDQFPYKSASGELYDVGNFPACSRPRKARRRTSRASPARRAVGGGGRQAPRSRDLLLHRVHPRRQSETATIEITQTGAKVYVGTQSNGQGHETVYAQLLHDQTGLPLEAIEIVQGDSDLIATGGGTGGSRSVTVQGMAMRAAGEALFPDYPRSWRRRWT